MGHHFACSTCKKLTIEFDECGCFERELTMEKGEAGTLHPSIEQADRYATEVTKQAEDDLNKIVKTVQSSCTHAVVTQLDWKSLYSGCRNARRICRTCGLEEVGSHWSGDSVWSRSDFKPVRLGNHTRRLIHVAKSDNEFYDLRIDGQPHNCEPAPA